MDTTLGMTIERVKRDASLNSRGPVYTLASQHVEGGTTVHVNEDILHAGIGSVLSMGISSYYVQSTDVVGKTFTVIPGYHGTEDETHDPPMVITIDDPFPGGALKDHAEKEIRSWGNKLWQVEVEEVATDGLNHTFEITPSTDPLYILEARRPPVEISSPNFLRDDDRWPRVKTRLIREADPTEFPSGFAVQFATIPPDGVVRVALAIPFDLAPFEWDTDLVTTVGLRERWIEILESGMRARALNGSIASRADWRAGGHERMAEEATVLDVIRAAEAASGERLRALNDAANQLRGEWPYRST